jgi:PKD repeat protein
MVRAYICFVIMILSAGSVLAQEIRLKARDGNRSIREKTVQSTASHPQINFRQQRAEALCITMEMDAARRAANPALGPLVDLEKQLQRDIADYSYALKSGRIAAEILTIPVIVHVIHNDENVGQGTNISAAQVQSQIDAFNEHFRKTGSGDNNNPVGADIEIEFVAALYDEQGERLDDPGVDRVSSGQDSWSRNDIEAQVKPMTIWDPYKYCNLWTVQFGEDDAGLIGYAQFPPQSGLDGLGPIGGSASTDGVVMSYWAFGTTGASVSRPYHEGKVASHEIGHWLGLRHTWGDGNCNADDFVADTPNANGAKWSSPLLGCPAEDECDEGVRMIENYMDYSYDECTNVFTQDQKTRMRTVMDVSPRRKELKNSNVDEERETPFARFSSEITAACEVTSIPFSDLSTNSPSSWLWTIYDDEGNIKVEYDIQNPDVPFLKLGNYDVRLIASNAAGADTILRKNYISIVSDSVVTSIHEDFEEPELALNIWLIYNPDEDRTFKFADFSAYGTGTKSIVMDNFNTEDDPGGAIDALVSPILDLSTLDNPYLLFDHAYALYQEEYSDTLAILYSTDCGETFRVLWSKGGEELATAPSTQESFEPGTDQWRSTQISLASLKLFSEVHLAIANVSGWGNNLYLDNLVVNDYSGTQAPQPVTILSSKTNICVDESIQFQDQTPEFPTSWLWTFEGGTPATSTEQNPDVTYATAGVYDVTLKVGNSIGETTEIFTDYITVNSRPVVSISPDKTTICPGEAFTLSSSGADEYYWFDERSTDPVSETDTYSTQLFEDRTFYLLGLATAGCADTTSMRIVLEPGANVLIQASATEVCAGELVEFTGTGGEAYFWLYENDTVSTDPTIELAFNATSTIGLAGTVSSGCPGFDQSNIVVNENPETIVTLDGLEFTSSLGESYQWYLNGAEIPGATSMSYAANSVGSYSVKLVNANGCSDESDPIEMTITSIHELSNTTKMRAYPNPAPGRFYFEVIGPEKGDYSYRLLNISGKLIQSGIFRKNVERYTHEISLDADSGVYFLQISDGENLGVLKIVK